jgi:flavin reductase (DIM6/NTAB) family NADH-FMN oxidoreductase RutF
MLSPAVHHLQPRASRPRVTEATDKTFRDAMRQLARSVCLITLGSGDERTGLIATSISSLSAEPPTLLVCVDRASPSYPDLTRLGVFAVNVLSADQREFAERFASGSDLSWAERIETDVGWPCPVGRTASPIRSPCSIAISKSRSNVMRTPLS